MKITESKVKQLTISGLERLDPIRVIMEDFGQGRGMITITCFGEAWSNYWGAMGEGALGEYVTIAEFFGFCSVDYLAGKLKNGLEENLCDEQALEDGCRKEVLKLRRESDIDMEEARVLWNEIDWADFDQPWQNNSDLFHKIFGDDWWHALPQRPNPEYVHLCRIVGAVKDGLKQHTEEHNKVEA